MKKFISLTLSAFMLLCLCACADNGAPSETAQPTKSPEPVTYTKEDGRLKMEVSYNPNGLLFSTLIYEYDDDGRLVKEVQFGVNDVPVGYESYEYDDKDRKSLMVSYLSDGDKDYSEDYRTSYEYNKDDELVKAVSTRGEKTESVTEYKYKNGLCVSETNYDGKSFALSEYRYEYNENKQKTRCVRIDNIEGDTTENRYTYTSNGLLLADLSYGDNGKVISRTEYSYDDKDNAIKLSVYTAKGELISSTSNGYTYDEYGNIKQCAVTHSDGSKGTTTKYKWEYGKG